MPYTVPSQPADPAPATFAVKIQTVEEYVRDLRGMKAAHSASIAYHTNAFNDLEDKIRDAISTADQVDPEIASKLRKI